MQKSCGDIATGALSATNCGSFASAESLNGKNGRLRPGFKGYFPFWLEYFAEMFLSELFATVRHLAEVAESGRH
nr:hypothetical protein [uncultured Prevotella sp.]